MQTDLFADHSTSTISPAEHVFRIIAGNDPLPFVTKALRAGAAGTITVRSIGGGADVEHPVLAGELIPARLTHVIASAPANMIIIGYS